MHVQWLLCVHSEALVGVRWTYRLCSEWGVSLICLDSPVNINVSVRASRVLQGHYMVQHRRMTLLLILFRKLMSFIAISLAHTNNTQ